MRTKYGIPAIALIAAMALTGCVDNSSPRPDPEDKVEVAVDEAAVALLPADIKAAGVLVVGIDLNYAPNEFKDDAGDPIGWAVDLGDAMATKLGLTMD